MKRKDEMKLGKDVYDNMTRDKCKTKEKAECVVLALVQDARRKSVDVTFDVCTTAYGGTWLLSSS